MPEISRFYGIVIRMFFRDHSPPHFHAVYGGAEMRVDILTGSVDGRFPRRAIMMVLEWWAAHRVELKENWERMSGGAAPERIEPLR